MSLDDTAAGSAPPGFATSARVRLAGAARDLVDAVLGTLDVDDGVLDGAADDVARVAERVRAAAGARYGRSGETPPESHRDYLPRSPVVGVASPIAPPLEWDVGDDGVVVAQGEFPVACEGPPGYVHGGWVALTFDEVLGITNAAAGFAGMTGRLTIRYRRPTPLAQPVRVECHVEKVEGRRIVTRARLVVDGATTAECEGLFVQPSPERVREYFGDRPAYGHGQTS